MKKTLTFLLPEEIPYQNKGEMAILEGLLVCLRSARSFRLAILNTNTKDALYTNDLPQVSHKRSFFLHDINHAGPVQFLLEAAKLLLAGAACRIGWLCSNDQPLGEAASSLRHFIEADVIVYGHDNYFAHRLNHRFAIISLFAKLAGKKTVVPGASIGPFKRASVYQRLMRRLILDDCAFITLRDHASADYLQMLGCKCRKTELTTDLAFLMPPSEDGTGQDLLSFVQDLTNEFILVGLTPTRYIARLMQSYDGNRLESYKAKYEAYLDMHVKAVDALCKSESVRVLLIPHTVGPESERNDILVNRDIHERCANPECVTSIEDEIPASVLKALIQRLHLLIGGRTHSIIAALGSGVPVLAESAPSRFKTNGIVGVLFGLEDRIFDVTHTDSQNFCKAVVEAVHRIDDDAMDITSRLGKVLKIANRNIVHFQDMIKQIRESSAPQQ